MANPAGRPIAPARKLVALVMGTIAVFLTVFGIGLASWAVVVFGVALLALSIALGMVNTVRRGARAWVDGTAEVRAISPPPASASAVYGRAEIQAVIVAPGLPTSEVTVRDSRVPVAKWPNPGDTLPITVDVDDMRRVRINWDEAGGRPTGEDPPPPPTPAGMYGDPDDQVDDDLLGDVEEPPWQTRPDDWDRPTAAYDNSPVVVHDTPDGRIVEGELVDAEDELPPLPRRAAASRPAEATIPDDLADQAGAAPTSPAPATYEPASAATGPSPDPVPSESAPSPGAAQSSGSAPSPSPAATSRPTAPSNPSPSAEFASSPSSATPSGSASPSGPAVPSGSPSPSRPASGFGPGAAAAGGFVAGAAASRRPSPHPRHRGGATATVDPEAMTAPPPAQRSPHPDDTFPTDIPLDDPLPRETPAPPAPATETAGNPTAAPAPANPWSRPQPTRTPAAPSPVSSFPTAPEPVAPPPTAPEPTGGRPTAPAPVFTPIDDIDVPLDGDPDVPPESTPAAAEARAEDLIAPPPSAEPAAEAEFPYDPVLPLLPEPAPATTGAPPAADEPPAPLEPSPASSTRFTTNAAHESTVPTESIPIQPAAEPSKHAAGAVVAGAAAAVGAAVAAVKRFGRHEQPSPATHSEPPADEPPSRAAAPRSEYTDTAPPTAPSDTEPIAQAEPTTDPEPIAESAGESGVLEPDLEPVVTPTARVATPPAGSESAAAAGVAVPGARSGGGPWADLTQGTQPDDRADDLITAYPSARPGPAGAIHGVGITILVTDLDRSVAFYRDLLGFFVIDRGAGSAVLASGDTRLVLRTVDGLSSEAGRLIYLNLEVGDVEAVYEDLKSRGITFVHAPRAVNRGERLELWSAAFEDPDGHNIAITQWRAAR